MQMRTCAWFVRNVHPGRRSSSTATSTPLRPARVLVTRWPAVYGTTAIVRRRFRESRQAKFRCCTWCSCETPGRRARRSCPTAPQLSDGTARPPPSSRSGTAPGVPGGDLACGRRHRGRAVVDEGDGTSEGGEAQLVRVDAGGGDSPGVRTLPVGCDRSGSAPMDTGPLRPSGSSGIPRPTRRGEEGTRSGVRRSASPTRTARSAPASSSRTSAARTSSSEGVTTGRHVVVGCRDQVVDLRVEHHLRTHPDSGVLEQWIEVVHGEDGPVRLAEYDSVAPVPAGHRTTPPSRTSAEAAGPTSGGGRPIHS